MTNSSNKLVLFEEYINLIENQENRNKFVEVLEFIIKKFPHLETVIKWNQPMFTDHGTFIVGFSITKNHINIAPERDTMIYFQDLIQARDVSSTKMLLQMKWTKPIDYELIEEIVKYNIIEKAKTTSFWR